MKKLKSNFRRKTEILALCITTMSLLTFTTIGSFGVEYGSGDVDDNGDVNIIDALIVGQYLANSRTLTSTQLAAADIDVDSDVDMSDANHIAAFYSTVIKSLPLKNVIYFTSDVHTNSGTLNGVDNLKTWLDIRKGYIGPQGLSQMIFGGDYDPSFGDTVADIEGECVDAITNIQEFLIDSINEPGEQIFLAVGNHDKDKLPFYSYHTGIVVDPATENYGIYIMDTDVTNQSAPRFKSDDMTALGKFLATVNSNVPVILVGHIPIHSYNNGYMAREYTLARSMITLLNNYPNTIYLYGHNHRMDDPAYSNPLYEGGNIQYDYKTPLAPGSYADIEFGYAAMGAMVDGAGQNRYGLVVTLDSFFNTITKQVETQVEFAYFDLAGNRYNYAVKQIPED